MFDNYSRIVSEVTYKAKHGAGLKMLKPKQMLQRLPIALAKVQRYNFKPETIKLLGSTKSKITEDKNCENLPCLEITEVVLMHCNIANNDYQQHSKVLCTFVPNKSFAQLLDISQKVLNS